MLTGLLKLLTNMLPIISIVISVISISININSWMQKRHRLKFVTCDGNDNSFFTNTSFNEFGYVDSECLAFVDLRISNPSDITCSINRIELKVKGYPSTTFRCTTRIYEEYKLYHHPNGEGRCTVVKKSRIFSMPCEISPRGYTEGFACFPYAPLYKQNVVKGEIVCYTTGKSFKHTTTLKFMEHSIISQREKHISTITFDDEVAIEF